MSEAPDYLDRSQTADFHLTLQVGADESPETMAETITALLGRAMLYRQPQLTALAPDRALAFTRADADRALVEALTPLGAGEQAAFRLLKAHARADDGRLLLVRVRHEGRNRAVILLATPAPDGQVDVHALAMLADQDLLDGITH